MNPLTDLWHGISEDKHHRFETSDQLRELAGDDVRPNALYFGTGYTNYLKGTAGYLDVMASWNEAGTILHQVIIGFSITEENGELTATQDCGGVPL